MSADFLPLRQYKPALVHHAADLEARATAQHVEALAWREAGRAPGAITGIDKLDRAIGGYMDEGVFILHGVPGVGKTAMALQIAADAQVPALFVTCEMAPEELFRRVACRIAEVPLSALRPGSSSTIERVSGALRLAARYADRLRFYDSRRDTLTHVGLRDVMSQEDFGCRFVVLDSLHAWALSMMDHSTEYEALNSAMDTLRALSSEFHIPILAVAERNRQSMAAGGLSAVAGTRRVEYGCDCMIELKQAAEDESPNPLKSAVVDVLAKVTKNRFGAAGAKVPLRFSLNLQRFTEATA